MKKALLCSILVFAFKGYCFANNAVLSWEPGDAAPVAGYKIYVGPTSGAYPLIYDVGLGSLDPTPCATVPAFAGCEKRTFTLFGFAPGTYYFAATAYNNLGFESGYSKEVSKTTVPDTTLPQDVINFTATKLNATDVRLSWTNPSDPDLAGLDLEYGYNGGPMTPLATLSSVLPSNAHTYDHKNLLPGTYTYAIHTRDTSGNRTNTAFTSASIGEPPPRITFNDGPAGGGCGMTKPSGRGGKTDVSMILMLLALVLTLTFRKSKEANMKILALALFVFLGLPESSSSAHEAKLGWNASDNSWGYEVFISQEGMQPGHYLHILRYDLAENGKSGTPAQISCTISGLKPETAYRFAVRAYSGLGLCYAESSPSNEAIKFTGMEPDVEPHAGVGIQCPDP